MVHTVVQVARKELLILRFRLLFYDDGFFFVVGNPSGHALEARNFSLILEAKGSGFEDNVVGRPIPDDVLNFHTKPSVHVN